MFDGQGARVEPRLKTFPQGKSKCRFQDSEESEAGSQHPEAEDWNNAAEFSNGGYQYFLRPTEIKCLRVEVTIKIQTEA